MTSMSTEKRLDPMGVPAVPGAAADEVGWVCFDPVSGVLKCGTCEGDLDFWMDSDDEIFYMKADIAKAGGHQPGPKPTGAIYCHYCCCDWEVPASMQLAVR